MNENEIRVLKIPISVIYADSASNCRTSIMAIDVEELAIDIRANGVLQPITVRPRTDKDINVDKKYQFILIIGFRRRIASIAAGLTVIPAIIRDNLSELEAAYINLSENMNRKDLNIKEEAHTIRKMMDKGAPKAEICRRVGKTLTWLHIRLKLLELPIEIQKDAEEGKITQHHIQQIARLKTEEEQFAQVKKIKAAVERGAAASSVIVTKPKENALTLKPRKPPEVQQLINFILKHFKQSLATRVLAWANGTIVNKVLWDALIEEARMLNIILPDPTVDYSIPETV